MPRHEFRPGRLVAGVTVVGAAVAYAGDAAGVWSIAWFAVFPVLVGGFLVAAVVALVHYLMRRRRSARTASSENIDVPASTSGSQAMR
ncbi:hypothetical protein [Streptomyces liangshanensis]|uniref:Uncharacterized protein n=1 Tax=Streptomyces liangshanensis TaxID=2717324 RepID=A0A6G9GYP0_9ACTN|nr:hypothetical protein [Streptomyces liangshanensis]QIQ03101.1 hypothetical protein HA039_12890 [Streptomyces liangshanensis]